MTIEDTTQDDSTAETGTEDPESPQVEEASGSAPVDEKPAEPVKAPTPEELELKGRFKLLEAAKREHLKVAASKREVNRISDVLAQQKQMLDQERAQFAARIERAEKIEKALTSGDLDTLAEFGLNYATATKGYLERGTPEAMAKAAMQRAEALEKQLNEERAQQQRQHLSMQQQRATQQQQQALVQLVDQHEEDYPDLYEWPQERVAAAGIEARDALAQANGQTPTYEQVLELLQRVAKREAESRKARLEQRQSRGTSNTKPVAGQTANRPGAPTLSNGAAANKVTPPRQKTEAELDEENLAALRLTFGGRA